MSTATVQRAYNDVVAPYYDLDPQGVTGDSLDRAVLQLRQHHAFDDAAPFRVLDLGHGHRAVPRQAQGPRRRADRPVRPRPGSENMVENARRKLPDLIAEVDDAANLDTRISRAVLRLHLHPFHHRLRADDACSRRKSGIASKTAATGRSSAARWEPIRCCRPRPARAWSAGGSAPAREPVNELVLQPGQLCGGRADAEAHGFDVCVAETFEPALAFRDFDEFMEFAYRAAG